VRRFAQQRRKLFWKRYCIFSLRKVKGRRRGRIRRKKQRERGR
jgi:hypothetical protein